MTHKKLSQWAADFQGIVDSQETTTWSNRSAALHARPEPADRATPAAPECATTSDRIQPIWLRCRLNAQPDKCARRGSHFVSGTQSLPLRQDPTPTPTQSEHLSCNGYGGVRVGEGIWIQVCVKGEVCVTDVHLAFRYPLVLSSIKCRGQAFLLNV